MQLNQSHTYGVIMDKLEIVEYSSGDKSIENRYHRFNKQLGRGAYKTVWKAFDTIKQVDVAWNSIELSTMTDNEKNRVLSECDMLQKLNHPNILKIRDKWQNPEKEELIFITDIIQNGSLRNYFRTRKINLKSIKHICRQILLALHYLHSEMSVIHRDLKCDNIFIDSSNNKIVLGDLGLSVCYEGQSRMSIVGTPHWMAPELYNEKYDELADIWSFGMCVLELCTNTIPYRECKNAIAVYTKVMMEKQKPDVLNTITDPYIKAFINICLDFNPALRPTSKELLSHPFLIPRYPRDYILCDKLLSTNNNNNNNKLKPPKAAKQKKPSAKTAKPAKKKSEKKKRDLVKTVKVDTKQNSITTIKLQIYTKDAKPMAVTFDFNVYVDKPADVANEMISELKLPEYYKAKVAAAIQQAVQHENILKTQIIGQSLTGDLPEMIKKAQNATATATATATANDASSAAASTNTANTVTANTATAASVASSTSQKPAANEANEKTVVQSNATNNVIENSTVNNNNTNNNHNNDAVNENININNNNNNTDKTEVVPPANTNEAATATTVAVQEKEKDATKNTEPGSVEATNSTLVEQEKANDFEMQNDLELKDVSAYIAPGEIDIDEKAKEQINKTREELLKEYGDYVCRKNELLKLRIESTADEQERTEAFLAMKENIGKKKQDITRQYEAVISDYKDIAVYTNTAIQKNMFQVFEFEQDETFVNVMGSNLSQNDKYEFENTMKDFRHGIIENYLSFYTKVIKEYAEKAH